MSDIRYTRDHEWLRTEQDGSITVGITDYAQEQLGDIVYVELPEQGTRCESGDNLVVIESVKAVGEVVSPVAGSIAASNAELADAPELLNTDPLGKGWLVRVIVDDSGALAQLMDEAAYSEYIAGL